MVEPAPSARLDDAPQQRIDGTRRDVDDRRGVGTRAVDGDPTPVHLGTGAVVDLRRTTSVVVVQVEDAHIRRRRVRQPLQRERQAREADGADLAVRAHLEAAVGGADGHRRHVPRRAVVGDPAAVEAPRDVRVRERPDQPFRDPEALDEGERWIGGLGLEPVGVRRGQSAAPEREEAELQEGLALRGVVRVEEVQGARPERAGWRHDGVVRQAGEPGILSLDDELQVRERHADARPQAAAEEIVAVGAPRPRPRPEPVDELAAEPLARREDDTVSPVPALPRRSRYGPEQQADEKSTHPHPSLRPGRRWGRAVQQRQAAHHGGTDAWSRTSRCWSW